MAAPRTTAALPAAGPPAPEAPARPMRIALIGNPNSGKTSLFNQLTGLNQKVGNFPGVTVDRKSGWAQLTPARRAEIVDLPGTYSLYPKSLDERVITDLLYDPSSTSYPDFVVVTVDASNLRRSLLLFSQLADLGLPAILALNMTDVAARHGVHIDLGALEAELGVPVVPMNARNGSGVAALKIVMAERLAAPPVRFWQPDAAVHPLVQRLRTHFQLHSDYLALHYAQQAEYLAFLSAEDRAYVQGLVQEYAFDGTAQQASETIGRYARINEILLETVTVTRTEQREPVSNRIDRVLTHRVGGYLIFLAVLFLLFQAIFAWAQYPMDLIDQSIGALSGWLQNTLPPGPLTRLLTEGVLAGLGGVLIFIPQIALLFAFLAVLEETGYMARVTFLMDKLMRPFGLSGKSVVPLISGLACAVPAIMGARTIESWKDRMITIFVTPLMSCSARIPVFTVLVALVVPAESVGFFNLRGVVLMGLYLLGLFSALGSAWLLKVLLKARERSYFIMEFPVYKWPRWKNVGLTIYQKVRAFVWQAGQVIVAISVLLWGLASYGPGQRQAVAEAQARREAAIHHWTPAELGRQVASARLETSYAGSFGQTLEPAIRPLGFDWKIGIALLTSFAAREVFVGTMSTIYSVGQDADMGTVQQKLRAEKGLDGKPFFTPARAFSLLVFYVFAMQCMSTLAVTYRETKSWRWPAAQLVYMTGLAYAASVLIWQIWGS
ncbi:ferrous iron transport protein B [Hymenobacter caeli]|uniref:Ferrous iron transport protein B n=1 Tax=Hymenobacter caeli TaxID=2735894 RepID=A0ABX2FM93_9BACT|nr:ferrous iron transport protein B [Hymenobacter caeli]NRT17943.1 ferrous iron transport protein B [Hymenobacter caeli]